MQRICLKRAGQEPTARIHLLIHVWSAQLDIQVRKQRSYAKLGAFIFLLLLFLVHLKQQLICSFSFSPPCSISHTNSDKGKYNPAAGNAECQDCDVGQFQDAPGSTMCSDCPSGWANKNNGSTSCNAVPAGFYTSQGKQSKCERGFTCAGADKSPEPCPNGTYTNSTGSVSCVPCSPGTFASSPVNLKCENCPAGWLQSEPMKSLCEIVGKGKVVAEGGSASIQVPLGSKICDVGSGCKNENAPFEACEEGTYGMPVPTNQCLNCPAGYSSSKAATECQAWCVSFFFFFLKQDSSLTHSIY